MDMQQEMESGRQNRKRRRIEDDVETEDPPARKKTKKKTKEPVTVVTEEKDSIEKKRQYTEAGSKSGFRFAMTCSPFGERADIFWEDSEDYKATTPQADNNAVTPDEVLREYGEKALKNPSYYVSVISAVFHASLPTNEQKWWFKPSYQHAVSTFRISYHPH